MIRTRCHKHSRGMSLYLAVCFGLVVLALLATPAAAQVGGAGAAQVGGAGAAQVGGAGAAQVGGAGAAQVGGAGAAQVGGAGGAGDFTAGTQSGRLFITQFKLATPSERVALRWALSVLGFEVR